MGCPDDNEIAALVEGAEESASRMAHVRHLDVCGSCRTAVGTLMALGAAPTRASPASDDDARRRTGRSASEVVARRYRLDRVVGEGGLGVVWAATDLETSKRVAVKVLKLEAPELEKRLLREARVSGLVDHPNVVTVHDVVEIEGGGLAMVMDLLEGESLAERLAKRGRMTCVETLTLLRPALSALRAAHALGIVHRDLKPANVFLAGDQTMLLDFGLAKLTASSGVAVQTSVLTREKQVVGTPHYMAPEQLYGEPDIDARADVWSVGVIVFECLAGRRPIDGRSVGRILQGLANDEIPRLDRVDGRVPSDLALVIEHMLQRDRAQRSTSLEPLATLAERYSAR